MTLTLTKNEIALLDSLNKHDVKFIIVGLSSAVLQGAHVVTQDIDLWIGEHDSENFASAIKPVGAFYIPPGVAGTNPPMLGPGEFRIFDLVTHMHGLDDFNEEYEKTIEVTLEGIKVRILSLERILLSKTSANREKDRAVIPALKAALAVQSSS